MPTFCNANYWRNFSINVKCNIFHKIRWQQCHTVQVTRWENWETCLLNLKKKKKRATKISGTPERMGRLYQGPYAMHISKYQLMIKVKAIDFQLPQWLLSLFAYAIHGIYSASDVCQNRISQMLENIEGAANSQDDIII